MHSDEEISMAQKIIAHVLYSQKLEEAAAPELYDAMFEPGVGLLVRGQAEALQAQIVQAKDVFYLVPNDSNFTLGFSRSALKAKLSHLSLPNADRDAEFMLSIFAFAILLHEFYSEDGSEKLRQSLSLSAWMEAVENTLKSCAMADSGEDGGRQSYAGLLKAWDARLPSNAGTAKWKTKEGLLLHALNFCKSQGLLMLDDMECIRTLPKLDDLAPRTILNASAPDFTERMNRLFAAHAAPSGEPDGTDEVRNGAEWTADMENEEDSDGNL